MREYRQQGQRVALVPTMGYLHEGHLALMRQAAKYNDVVVTSIFVNPIQFGPGEDLERYPRDLGRDSELARGAGVDILFVPTVETIYPERFSTFVEVEGMTARLCGRSRPGHFRGVTTVVLKLLMIIQPDQVIFGQKDAQQVRVIQQMVADLNVPVEMLVVPTVREPDGLAMSSRNKFLDPAERRRALSIPRALLVAEAMVREGERSAPGVIQAIQQILEQDNIIIDYIAVVDTSRLEDMTLIEGDVLVAVAGWVGTTRLIDNLVLEV